MHGPAGGDEPDEVGRLVRGPSVPYTPTDKERREHNRTHYPHRAWCEICMGGRAAAGRHRNCPDEVDVRAGEFHFDYCFLKSQVREEPAVTLIGVDKATDSLIGHVVPEKGRGSTGSLNNWSGTSVVLGIMEG